MKLLKFIAVVVLAAPVLALAQEADDHAASSMKKEATYYVSDDVAIPAFPFATPQACEAEALSDGGKCMSASDALVIERTRSESIFD